jgi:hypothetical protein
MFRGRSLRCRAEPHTAFQCLEQNYTNANGELILAIRHPALDPLRCDVRYKERRLGLPE